MDAGAGGRDGPPDDASGFDVGEATPPEPSILSAYLGLLDANGFTASTLETISGCEQLAGDDAMSVVFNVHLAPSSVQPDDFAVIRASGAVATPICATLRPATGADERRTVLLTGPLGTEADPPARVDVVGQLTATDREGAEEQLVEGLASPPVRRSVEGPIIELAVHWADDDAFACPGSGTRIQTTWSGGVTSRFGREFDSSDLTRFSVDTLDPLTGEEDVVAPLSFADLDDGDNHLDLCIAAGLVPQRVTAAPDTAFDPTNHPNPPCAAAVSVR